VREANQKVKALQTKKKRDELAEQRQPAKPASPAEKAPSAVREITDGRGAPDADAATPEATPSAAVEAPKPESKKPKRKPKSKERVVKTPPPGEQSEQMSLDLTEPEPTPEPSTGKTTTAKFTVDGSVTRRIKTGFMRADTPEQLDDVRKDLNKAVEQLRLEQSQLQEIVQTTNDGNQRVRAAERAAAIRSELVQLQKLSERINDKSEQLMRRAEDASSATPTLSTTNSQLLAKYDQYSTDMTAKIGSLQKAVAKMSNVEVEVALKSSLLLEEEMTNLIVYINTLENAGDYDVQAIVRNVNQIRALNKELKKRLPGRRNT
jgi:hypothetical protein